MNFDQKVIVSTEVLSQKVSGETVLLDLQTESYFGLDRVGTRIWDLMRAGRGLREIFDLMLTEYDVAPDQLASDLEQIVEKLLKAGLIQLEASGD